jgi:predicted small metal-binding protein
MAMPSFKCKDLGMNRDFETTAANEMELMKNITQHAMTEHEMMSIAPDMIAKIKSAIQK